jgi:hypothetical protein
MAPEEYAAMPFSYEAVSQVRMPEAQRAMPEGEQGGDVTLTRLREIRDGLDENLTEREAIDELDFIINDAPSGYFPQDILNKVDQAKRDLEEEFTTWAGRGDSEASTESAISSVMSFLDSKESRGEAAPTRFMPEGVSPEDLNPVANKQEAQGLWADGKRMFALNEMDEKLTPITSKAMLDSYSADAIGWMEPQAQNRFMPEKLDSDYMKAVESGDVEAQQRMVDERARRMGYTTGKVYHGTKQRFNEFESKRDVTNLIYFSFDKKFAEQYPRGSGGHREPTPEVRQRIDEVRAEREEVFRPIANALDEKYPNGGDTEEGLAAWVKYFDDQKEWEKSRLDGMTISQADMEMGIQVIPAYLATNRIFDPKTGWKEFKTEILDALNERSVNDLMPQTIKMIEDGNYIIWERKNIIDSVFNKYDGLILNESGSKNIAVRDPSLIKRSDPITRDDSGNVIPPSKRFDVTSNDLRFMPEPANPAAPNVAFKKPLSRTDPIPDIDSTLINDSVDINGFAFDRPAKVYMQHPNGEKTYFNYDPAYLIKPKFKDLRATLAGKNIVILEADKMRATGGDMGGVLHPFLRSNQTTVRGSDGKLYKAIWANMNSGFVTRTKNRWFKDNATYAVIHLMDDIAHSSNKRVARMVDEAWAKANLADYEQRVVAVAMQSAITAEQKAGYNIKITQAKSRIKSGKLTPEKIASENKAIADWLDERNALSWTGIDQEIAKKITQLKSAQTRLQNKTGNQAGLDKAKQALRDYLDADQAHAAAFDSISQRGASLKISDNIGNTFKSRGAAIQGILGIAFDKFNPSDLLKKTEDFQGSENMDLVAAVQLSKNKDIFAVYFGTDPKEEAAMSASERKVRDKLRSDPNFVEHEAFDWMMLGPHNADNFMAESSLRPEELIPTYRNQHPKTSVKNGSAETVLGAMKMFSGIPLTVAKKTKISNVKSEKKALAEQLLKLQNMK